MTKQTAHSSSSETQGGKEEMQVSSKVINTILHQHLKEYTIKGKVKIGKKKRKCKKLRKKISAR
jgi:hypothetical protein